MKNFTKLLGIVLIIALVMSMGTMAFAEENPTGGSGTGTETGGSTTPATTATIKIGSTGTEGHTYKVFQIFTGEAGTAAGELINLKYGRNITGTGREAGKAVSQADLTNILADLEYTARNVNDVEELATLKQFVDLTDANAIATLTGSGTATVPTGYYLIKDEDNSLVDGDGNPIDEAYTLYLMSVIKAGDTYTIEPKASVPEVEKKVKDVNDSAALVDGTNPTDWQDSADHDIGDVIDYKITGTLPSTFADYNSYTTYTFTDTLSNGLTITADQLAALTIKVNGTTDVKGWFDVVLNEQVLTISLKANTDLKTVTYGTSDTKLTANDKIVVEYKATLNENAKIGSEGNPNTVDLEFTNNPNVGGTGTGKTPEDKVIVFTYKTTVDKIDPDGNDLTGADFTLYKEVPQGTTGATKGSALTFGDNVEHSAIGADKYYVVAGQKTGTTAGSQFEFKGIDDGTYVLVETTVPTGYNAWTSATVTVTATHDATSDDPQLTELTATAPFTTSNATAGSVERTKEGTTHDRVSGEAYAEIINQSGTVLPSTGGIGTTIFYVVGSILVVAAGVLLITKKRMSREG